MTTSVGVLVLVTFLVWPGSCQQCSELVCPGNGCLLRTNVCDNNTDCTNGRGFTIDEINCSGSNYTCINDSEIDVEMLCDGNDDCGDNSDEDNELCPILVPLVDISISSSQIVGQSLTLECSITTVSTINGAVGIEWSSNGLVLQSTEAINSISINSTSVLYMDSYNISQLSTADEDKIFQCTVIVNGTLQVNATDSVMLDVTVPSINITTLSTGAMQGTVVGSRRDINCTIIAIDGVDISSVMFSWTAPGGAIITNSSRVTISQTISTDNGYTSTLQFANIMQQDEGAYTCTVMILDTRVSSIINISNVTTTTPKPPSDSSDDEYDLVIPRLVLFFLIPFIIVLLLIIVVPVLSLWFWRREKLKAMKTRLRIAESYRHGSDTLEQDTLTQGTYRNIYAESSFGAANQTSPALSHSRMSTAPRPRSPAPPPPVSHQQQPPSSSNDEPTPPESTNDVTIEAEMPPPHVSPSIAGNRTSTMSGAFDVLAAVTAAEAAKRHSTISGGEDSSSKLRHSSSSSAFHSLGRRERPTTPPPPPPPPINGPPPVAPKPNRNLDTHDETDDQLEPLYEQIPGDRPDYPIGDSGENLYDDAAVHAGQETTSNNSSDTYDVPRSLTDPNDTYDTPIPSIPPPRPPKPAKFSQNPLDRLVLEEDPVCQINDTDQEVCNLNEIDSTYEVLDLHDND